MISWKTIKVWWYYEVLPTSHWLVIIIYGIQISSSLKINHKNILKNILEM